MAWPSASGPTAHPDLHKSGVCWSSSLPGCVPGPVALHWPGHQVLRVLLLPLRGGHGYRSNRQTRSEALLSHPQINGGEVLQAYAQVYPFDVSVGSGCRRSARGQSARASLTRELLSRASGRSRSGGFDHCGRDVRALVGESKC